jgi:hypothetical protein
MTRETSWPASTVTSDQHLLMMLGEMRADARHTLLAMDRVETHLGQIDQRLAQGDATMGALQRTTEDLNRRMEEQEARPTEPPPTWERNGKYLLTYLLPLGVLYATGNADIAKQALGLMLGAK